MRGKISCLYSDTLAAQTRSDDEDDLEATMAALTVKLNQAKQDRLDANRRNEDLENELGELQIAIDGSNTRSRSTAVRTTKHLTSRLFLLFTARLRFATAARADENMSNVAK